MIGIILTGHGKIAEGIESSIKLVFGKPEKFYSINFTEDITPELLEKEIEEKIDELNGEEGVLIFTDIAGGTPFKTASVLSLKKEKVKVISGMNLPMVLETVCERMKENLKKEFNKKNKIVRRNQEIRMYVIKHSYPVY